MSLCTPSIIQNVYKVHQCISVLCTLTIRQSVHSTGIRDLGQQVMSPGAQNYSALMVLLSVSIAIRLLLHKNSLSSQHEFQDSSTLAILLSGSTIYKKWVKSMINYLITHSFEWEEEGGLRDVQTFLPNPTFLLNLCRSQRGCLIPCYSC